MNDFSLGSLWRKWDLHVHSPASYNYKGSYNKLVENINSCEAAVIGINDYFTIEGYEKIINDYKINNKVLFPVIEFRMNNSLPNRHNPKSQININFHVIFNNNGETLIRVKNWLTSLLCFNESGNKDQLGNIDKTLYSKTSVDYFNTIKSLKEIDKLKNNFLVLLPYNEYGGIDDINPETDGFFKLGLIKECDIIGSSTQNQIEFFLWKNSKYNKEEYERWFEKPYPCIKGSDAHHEEYPIGRLMNEKSEPINKYCWIKADMTFDGLRQIIHEPDERVFIGEYPSIMERVQNEPNKFIKSLIINKNDDKALKDEDWFDNIKISFNYELVALIGNKGSGKSAIVDIIGLLGNTQNYDDFSFLNEEKFLKQPDNRARYFTGILNWVSGKPDKKIINDFPQKHALEKVKYIPQNYLEKLCTTVKTEGEEDKFQKELKEVIFSHVPQNKRLEKSSLEELENYLTEIVVKEIRNTQNEIKKINDKLIGLEIKLTEEYRESIISKLNKKQVEYKLILKNEPQKVDKPDRKKTDPKLKGLSEKFEKLHKEKKILNVKFDSLYKKSEKLNSDYTELRKILKDFDSFNKEFNELKELYNKPLEKFGFKFDDIFSITYDRKLIYDKVKNLSSELESVNYQLDETVEDSIISKINKINIEIKKVKSKLDEPTKKYQDYLEKISDWKDKINTAKGSKRIEGSLEYYIAEFEFINKKLRNEIDEIRKERIIKVKEILSKKKEIIDEYSNLYKPLEKFIEEKEVHGDEYQINFEVALELKYFKNVFFKYINQNRIGSFYGIEQGESRIKNIIKRTNFKDDNSIINFLNEIIVNLENDVRNEKNILENEITKQIKPEELSEFYNFLFGLDYLKPSYRIKLGEKELSELSPGEKGAILLIFYLLIDRSNIPLIIDQPEENLDNESVYNILVNYMRIAKKRRQIFIVTHNPNLAVVCDADQVICVNIDKKNKFKFNFISGSIENPEINMNIVRILEGTMPAFDLRDKKYTVSKRIKKFD